MVDVVVNHMAWAGIASTVQYATLTPFNESSYFHSYCDITQNATMVRREITMPQWHANAI